MAHSLLALTGATGFLGGTLVKALSPHFRVRALVRTPQPSASMPEAFEHVRGSLSDTDALDALCEGAQTVVHCAGAIRAPSRQAFWDTNVAGTERLLEAAIKAGVKRFILISSMAAQEPHLSDYAWSKREGERVLGERRDKIEGIALRPPPIYGPGDRATLPLFRTLKGRFAPLPVASSQKVSVLYSEDAASAVIHVLEHWPVLWSLVKDGDHICVDDGPSEGPRGYDWPEICAIASGYWKRTVTPVFLPRPVMVGVSGVMWAWSRVFGGLPLVALDKIGELYHTDWVSRGPHLSALTSWRPEVQFAEGFSRVQKWYHYHGWM